MDFVNFLNYAVQSYLPTPKSRRDKFVNLVQDKVSQYIPVVENKFNISLGEFTVLPLSKYINYLIKNDSAFSEVKPFIAKAVGTPVLHASLFWSNTQLFTVKEHNAIFVPFKFMNHFGDPFFEYRASILDQAVVHELTHKVWHAFSDDKSADIPTLWEEGFPTFCEQILFKDDYPEKYRINSRHTPRKNKLGSNIVNNIYKNEGIEAIKKLPQSYTNYDTSTILNELNKKI